MNRRERVADWISGGALTEARLKASAAMGRMADGNGRANSMEFTIYRLTRTLERIAAMETPGAAPAAKRMAKVAREALDT